MPRLGVFFAVRKAGEPIFRLFPTLSCLKKGAESL